MQLSALNSLLKCDIVLCRTEDLVIRPEERISTQGAIISGREYRWPNGVVPFSIDPTLSELMQGRIWAAMEHWTENTRIETSSRIAGSANGADTIVPHDPTAIIGEAKGLSAGDVAAVAMMYPHPYRYANVAHYRFGSNGSGFFRGGYERFQSVFTPEAWLVGDFDGDGRDDLVLVYGAATYGATAWIYTSTGSRFTRTRTQRLGVDFWDSQVWLPADLDGDGADGVSLFYKRTRWVGN